MPTKLILKFIFIISALLTLLIVLTACSNNKKDQLQSSVSSAGETVLPSAENVAIPQKVNNDKNKYKNDGVKIDTFIILNNESTTIKGSGASFENGVLTISEGGTYSLQGILSNGKIILNSTDNKKNIILYLNGVDIRSSTDAPLFIENSLKETVIFLSKGSFNSLSDTSREYIEDVSADTKNSVIYSTGNLLFDGKGTLNIGAHFDKAVFSERHITVKNGIINIESIKDGINGKQGVTINAGTVNITCGGRGICTAKKPDKDNNGTNISVSDGIISVYSDKDCIFSSSDITITGGTFNLVSGGGCMGISENEPTTEEQEDIDIFDFLDRDGQRKPHNEAPSPEKGPAGKGIKANGILTVSGGAFNISSVGNSIHASEIILSGGSFSIASDDTAIFSDGEFSNENTNINIAYSKKNFHFLKNQPPYE